MKLWEILYEHSDEKHPLSTKQIIDLLAQKGMNIERRTLYEDINLLNRCGYEIMCVKKHSNYYYTVLILVARFTK